jgi:hypothetical protein
MAFSVMLRCVALVRTDVSEELSASTETSVLSRDTQLNVPEDAILQELFLKINDNII